LGNALHFPNHNNHNKIEATKTNTMDMKLVPNDRSKQNTGQQGRELSQPEEPTVEYPRILSTCDYICEEHQFSSKRNMKESTVLNNNESVDLDESLETYKKSF
jgi:hypothetical protein